MSFTEKNQWQLLKLIKEGKSQKTIAKTLKFAPSVINYHVGKLLKNNHIREIKTTKYLGLHEKTYSLTDEGKTTFLLLNSTFSQGGEENKHPRWNLHHVTWKYKIIKDAPIHMPVEIHMRNWDKLLDPCWKYATPEKTSTHILIHVKQLFGNNQHELELRSRNIADTMISIYEGHHGMEFGRPVRVGNPHFVELLDDDEVWEYYKQFYYIETESGIMDKTPPKGKEFTSVESATNHINVGDNVAKLMGGVGNLKDRIGTLENRVDEQNNILMEIRNSLNKYFESQIYKSLPKEDEYRDVA